MEATNLTLLNSALIWFGPMREYTLVNTLLFLQVASSVAAFGVRYGLASLVYDGDRR